MIHNKDHILRIIEQLGHALRQLLQEIRRGSAEELAGIEADLSGIAHQAGLDLELALNLSLDSLSILVGNADDPDPGRCWLLAELLYLHGLQTATRRGEAAARGSYSRSLHLFRMVRPEWERHLPVTDVAARVLDIEGRLGSDAMRPES